MSSQRDEDRTFPALGKGAPTLRDGLCAVTGRNIGLRGGHWIIAGGRYRQVADDVFDRYDGEELRRLVAERDAEIGLGPAEGR